MPRTVLLADDSVTIQKVVGISFANEDVELLTVDNGDDALARIREARPEVVLADVVMPGKNGYEVCEAVKTDPELSHIRVLLLTGTFEAFDEERARRAGADGHITKPFEAQTLVDRVNDLLAQATPAPWEAVRAEPSGARESPLDLFDEELPEAEVFSPGEGESLEVLDLEVEAEPESFAVAAPRRGASSRAGEPFAEEPVAPAEPVAERIARATLEEEEGWPAETAPAPTLGERDLSGPGRAEGGELETFLEEEPSEAQEVPPSLLAELEPETPEAASRVPASAASASPLDLELGLDSAGPSPGEDPLARVEPDDLARAAVVDPAAGADYDVSSSDLGDPGSTPEPTRPPAPAGAPPRPGGLPPATREQLRTTLEKIAWETFGDLAETLVKQTVARVEAVAWEVIPQLAEALIREEIRKLKGEESET